MSSKLLSSAFALATTCLLGAIPAGASTIYIGLADAPGASAITTMPGGGGSTASWAGLFDGYSFSFITANDPKPIALGSSVLNVSAPAGLGGPTGPIYVYVTETGITSSQASLNFTNYLNIEYLAPGWSQTVSTYVDSTNAPFGTGTQLASWSSPGSNTSNTSASVPTGSPFSVTEQFIISSNGFGGADESKAYVTASVQPAPAPAIGVGVPGVLAVGGVLLGMTVLRRSRRPS